MTVHDSHSSHRLVDNVGLGIARRAECVDVHHMSSPVVFPWEGLSALPRIWAARLGTVVLSRLVVLVVDVAVQVCFGAESLATSRSFALMWPFVIPLMVAISRQHSTTSSPQGNGERT